MILDTPTGNPRNQSWHQGRRSLPAIRGGAYDRPIRAGARREVPVGHVDYGQRTALSFRFKRRDPRRRSSEFGAPCPDYCASGTN